MVEENPVFVEALTRSNSEVCDGAFSQNAEGEQYLEPGEKGVVLAKRRDVYSRLLKSWPILERFV